MDGNIAFRDQWTELLNENKLAKKKFNFLKAINAGFVDGLCRGCHREEKST